MQADVDRSLYVGVVNLLCRVYAALEPDAKREFVDEGVMERVAADFNRGSTLEMAKAGRGWGLFERARKE